MAARESRIDGALRTELRSLVTERADPALASIDALGTLEAARLMNAGDALVADAVGRALPTIADAVDRIADRMRGGGRLIYLGAGTPGRLGVLDASECPPTFGTHPGRVVGLIAGGAEALTTAVEGAEDDPEEAARALAALGLTWRDTVVGITASGRTPYVLGGLAAARAEGALTVAVACNEGSAAGHAAEVAIEVVVGPEFIAGSTRLRAGTAQKLVLNMLSTLAMVRLGKTYGNLMVDLVATNLKLEARAAEIVYEATGAAEEEISAALGACGGEVKTAIASIILGCGPDEARARIAHHGGALRSALQDTEETTRER
jgi:N-acetylmuramic acid 6-phosphate etherase